MAIHVKKGDHVMVISGGKRHGEDKQATVTSVDTDSGRITLEGDGATTVKKHFKPRRAQDKGGIIDKPATIDASNVMIVCGACGKPTRMGHAFVVREGKTIKIRVCKKCGMDIDTKSERAARTEAKVKVRKKVKA